MPLFLVAAVEKRDEDIRISIVGKEKVIRDKKGERLLVDPFWVMARDEDAAKVEVGERLRDIEYDKDLLEVLCRPFDE